MQGRIEALEMAAGEREELVRSLEERQDDHTIPIFRLKQGYLGN